MLATNKTNYNVYNIGNNHEYEIKDIVAKIFKIIDKPYDVEIVKRDNNFIEIKRQSINANRLMQDIGWVPSCNLTQGLMKSIDWYFKEYK